MALRDLVSLAHVRTIERRLELTPGLRRVLGPGMGIGDQFRCPLYHLLRHMAVVARLRPARGALPWLHAYRQTNSQPRPSERERQRLLGLPLSTATNLTIPRNGTVRENARTAADRRGRPGLGAGMRWRPNLGILA
jgi:hypothetical protein